MINYTHRTIKAYQSPQALRRLTGLLFHISIIPTSLTRPHLYSVAVLFLQLFLTSNAFFSSTVRSRKNILFHDKVCRHFKIKRTASMLQDLTLCPSCPSWPDAPVSVWAPLIPQNVSTARTPTSPPRPPFFSASPPSVWGPSENLWCIYQSERVFFLPSLKLTFTGYIHTHTHT